MTIETDRILTLEIKLDTLIETVTHMSTQDTKFYDDYYKEAKVCSDRIALTEIEIAKASTGLIALRWLVGIIVTTMIALVISNALPKHGTKVAYQPRSIQGLLVITAQCNVGTSANNRSFTNAKIM